MQNVKKRMSELKRKMLTLQEIKDGLESKTPNEIMEATGLSRPCVFRLKRGLAMSYNLETIAIVSKYISEFNKEENK